MVDNEKQLAKPEYSDEMCRYFFTEEEERDLAKDMARKVSEIEETRDRKKSVSKAYDGQIEALDAEIKSLSRKLQDGHEMRNIRCVVEKDFMTKSVRFIRTDTGELARTRAMTAAEVQIELDFTA